MCVCVSENHGGRLRLYGDHVRSEQVSEAQGLTAGCVSRQSLVSPSPVWCSGAMIPLTEAGPSGL